MQVSHENTWGLFNLIYSDNNFLNNFLHITEQLSLLAPSECPHLILQALAGPMAAATASTITNPMDVVRARVQVKPKK